MVAVFDKREWNKEYLAKRAKASRGISIREPADVLRREALLLDPVAFLKFYFPKRFTRPFSDDQIDGIRSMCEAVEYSTDQMICAARGDWKTETLKHLVVYWMLACKVRFPVWIGATISDAARSFADIKSEFEGDILAADFPEVCDPVLALNGSPVLGARQEYNGVRTRIEWKAEHLVFPTITLPDHEEPTRWSGMKLTYRGLDGAVRGLNLYGDRPDLAPCDDLETRDSADSDKQIQDRETLLDNDIGGLGSGERIPRIVLGTIQNEKCLTNKKRKEWGGKRYQAVKVWPADEDSIQHRDHYIELRKSEKQSDGEKTFDESHTYYRDNQDAIERNLVLGNPWNYSKKIRKDGRPLEWSAFQKVLNEVADKGWNYVWAELQNDPKTDEKKSVNLRYTDVLKKISGLDKNGIPPRENTTIALGIDVGWYWSHWVKMVFHGNCIGHVLDYGVIEVPGSQNGKNELSVLRSLIEWLPRVTDLNTPDVALIDSGDGNLTNVIYQFCRQSNGIVKPAKNVGPKNGGKLHIPHESDTCKPFDNGYASWQEEQKLWLFNIHSSYWRRWTQNRFAQDTLDENNQWNSGAYSLFASSNDREHHTYAQHIVSWELDEKFIAGKGLVSEYRPVSENDHFLDATLLCSVGANVKGSKLLVKNDPPVFAGEVVTKRTERERSSRFRSRPGGWIPKRR